MAQEVLRNVDVGLPRDLICERMPKVVRMDVHIYSGSRSDTHNQLAERPRRRRALRVVKPLRIEGRVLNRCAGSTGFRF